MKKSIRKYRFISIIFCVAIIFSAIVFRGDRAFTKNNSLMLVPNLSATKTAVQQTDVNGNGFVNPGDGLRYTVQINNTGADPATGVSINDTIDVNTTLVGGSVVASPIAVNDAYSSIGNVGINVPAGSGVLVNDLNANTAALCSVGNTCTITTAGSFSSANGGSVTLNADGSFIYNPPIGFEGGDTFTYTLANGTGFTDTSTVSITVSGIIWFINNNAASCTTIAAGCGTLAKPFSTLAAFNTANVGGGSNPDNNDNIFIYESGTTYSGAVTLRTGQKLIGQDATASLDTIAGITLPAFSNPLPAMNSANGTITNITSTVTLNTNTTLRGFSINSTTSTGVSGGAVSGVTTSEVNVMTTTGTAISLSGTGGTLSFISVSANGAGTGISLNNTTGSFAVNGVGTTAGSGGTIQNITNRGASFIGATNITLKNMNFMLVGTVNGADPTNAGSSCGSLANGQGGNLGCSAGIHLVDVVGATFDRLVMNNLSGGNSSGQQGINGNNVTSFNMSNSSVLNFGNETRESGIQFRNLVGTAGQPSTITGSAITGNETDQLLVYNNSGTLTSFTVSGSTLGTSSAPNGTAAIQFIGDNTANMTMSVTGSTLSNNATDGFFSTGSGSSTVNVTVSGCTIQNNLNSAVNVSTQNSGNSTFNILNNPTITGSGGNAININLALPSTGTLQGTISGNIVGTATPNSGSTGSGNGVNISSNGSGTLTAAVTNNTIKSLNGGSGITAIARDGNSAMNLTITGNNVDENSPNASNGIFVSSGAAGTDTTSVCADIGGAGALKNTITDQTGVGNLDELRIRNRFAGTTFRLPGYAGSGTDTAAVVAYLIARNSNAGQTSATLNSNSFGGGAACTQPAFASPIAEGQDQINDLSFLDSTYQSSLAFLNYIQSSDKQFTAEEITEANEITQASAPNYLYSIRRTFSRIYNGLAEAISPTAHASGETVTKALGTLPAGENIRVQFDVTVDANIPTNKFSVSNTASISATNHATFNSTTATTTVVQPPTISKAFGAANIALNDTTTLTFTIGNANPGTNFTMTAFTDNLPAGLIVATPNGLVNNCGGGTVTAADGSSSISVSALSRTQNTTCTIQVDVTATTAGMKNNTTTAVSSFEGGTGMTSNTAVLTVLAPTAASVNVSGRVVTATGRGVSKAMLTMTDSNGSVRYAMTNPFGYYRFVDVGVGQTYIVSVKSKQYEFAQPTIVLQVNDELNSLDFTAMTAP